MSETEVRASGRNALIGSRPMSRVGRAKEFGETRGFMKVLVDADTDEILGASILDLSGDESVHALLDVMYTGAPYTVTLAPCISIRRSPSCCRRYSKPCGHSNDAGADPYPPARTCVYRESVVGRKDAVAGEKPFREGQACAAGRAGSLT